MTLLLGIFTVLVAMAAFAAVSSPVVSTTAGQVRGAMLEQGGSVFKGIPYAQAPAGNFRWREPMPVKPWRGVRDATAFGAICPQNPNPTMPNAAEIFSEDCLSLNVWVSEWPPKAKKPVFFWIHGGGNMNGGTSEARYDGESLARRGVVVVTFN
jgi:para-nitrobenzyl esterase